MNILHDVFNYAAALPRQAISSISTSWTKLTPQQQKVAAIVSVVALAIIALIALIGITSCCCDDDDFSHYAPPRPPATYKPPSPTPAPRRPDVTKPYSPPTVKKTDSQQPTFSWAPPSSSPKPAPKSHNFGLNFPLKTPTSPQGADDMTPRTLQAIIDLHDQDEKQKSGAPFSVAPAPVAPTQVAPPPVTPAPFAPPPIDNSKLNESIVPQEPKLAALVEIEGLINLVKEDIAFQLDLKKTMSDLPPEFVVDPTITQPNPKVAPAPASTAAPTQPSKKGAKLDDSVLDDDDLNNSTASAPAKPLPASQPGDTDIDFEIVQLKTKLESTLQQYPDLFFNYLENRFASGSSDQKEMDEIYLHMAYLSGLMKNHEDQTVFIQNCLSKIDQFFGKLFFTSKTEMCLQEQDKINLIIFGDFFDIVDRHLPTLNGKDDALKTRLKIKFANLPLREETKKRASYQNLYLAEKEQAQILIRHFISKEEQVVDAAIQDLQNYHLSDEDLKRLTKLVSSSSRLEQKNLLRLRDALANKMGISAPTLWTYQRGNGLLYGKIKYYYQNQVNQYNQGYGYQYYSSSNGLTALYQASKAKTFLTKYGEVNRWCHATKSDCLASIIDSVIRVEHRQEYKGAFVSTRRETQFGTHVLGLNHGIMEGVDPTAFIGYQHGKVRWRGLQKEIPMKGKDSAGKEFAYLIFVGLPTGTSKSYKADIKVHLKNQNLNVPVYYVDLIDYLQTEMLAVIGSPNLNFKWWGKFDAEIEDNRRKVDGALRNLNNKHFLASLKEPANTKNFKDAERFLKFLAKATSDKTDLDQDNLRSLRNGLYNILGLKTPASWNDETITFDALKRHYNI